MWPVPVWHGWRGPVWLVGVRQVKARQFEVGLAWLGMAWRSAGLRMVSPRPVCLGRSGMVGYGPLRWGEAWHGMVGQVWPGRSRLGVSWHGPVRLAR